MSAIAALSPLEFAATVYRAADSLDAEQFSQFLSEDCTFVYANEAPVRGRAQAAACVKGFTSMISGMCHELNAVWQCDDTIICRMRVTYTRKDGSTLTVPAMTSWQVREGLISEYLIYVDVSQLFAN